MHVVHSMGFKLYGGLFLKPNFVCITRNVLKNKIFLVLFSFVFVYQTYIVVNDKLDFNRCVFRWTRQTSNVYLKMRKTNTLKIFNLKFCSDQKDSEKTLFIDVYLKVELL